MMLRSGAIDTKEMREIRCPHMGNVNVYVQGQRFPKETVVLNVHDLGYNHLHYVDFLNEPGMSRIAQKSVWVFVILPGQISNCVNLPEGYTFPTLQEIAEDLVTILNELHVKEVVLFGDRAGANILMRFALANPNRVLGAFLINATAASNNILDSIQDKFRNWITSDDDKTSADDYLVYHRFGAKPDAIMKYHHSNATRMIVERYRDFVHRNLNIHNVKLYIDAFNKRTAITDITSLRCSAVFMTSERSVFRKTTRLIHQALLKVNYAKTKVEFVDVSDVGNVMEETPEKVIESLQYFLQGLGIVASAPLPNLNPAGKQQTKSRSVSVSAMTSSHSLDKPVQTRPRNVSVVEYSGSTGKAADGRAHAHARRSGPPGSPLYVAGQPISRGSDEELAMKRGSNPILHKIKEEDEEFKPHKNWMTFTSPETGANKAAVNGNSEP